MADWPAGHGREIHDRLDSTNAEALRRAAREAGPLWIMARDQTAARGRRRRAWRTGAGNFAASLLIAPRGGPAAAALHAFVAALALRDALGELTGRPGLFTLKWPNDVLLSGGKLAGILLETARPPLRLAIGFGVNLAEAPDPSTLEDTAMTPISLKAATGVAVPPEALLDRLAPAYAAWQRRLAADGFPPIRAAWLEAAAGLGAPVTARLPGRSVHGRFETIDPSGAIVLATAAGTVALPAADIHLGPDPKPAPGPVPDDLPGQEPPPGPGQPPEEPPVGDPPGPEAPPEQPPPREPPGPGTPPEIPPGVPPGPDVPDEQPPVGDPPGPDAPPEVPPELPPQTPPPAPQELPPSTPPELPQQIRHAARD